MAPFQKLLVADTDRFDPENFAPLQTSLHQVAAQLTREPDGPKAEMLVSFVKDHCISSQSVKDYPKLARLISSQSLPLTEMENLFEASKGNPGFRNDLETYIKTYLKAARI